MLFLSTPAATSVGLASKYLCKSLFWLFWVYFYSNTSTFCAVVQLWQLHIVLVLSLFFQLSGINMLSFSSVMYEKSSWLVPLVVFLVFSLQRLLKYFLLYKECLVFIVMFINLCPLILK